MWLGLCPLEEGELAKAKLLEGEAAMWKLLCISVICFIFMTAEFVGGYLSHSLAIMTDAAHMLSDVASFMISYFASYVGARRGTAKMSYGYARAEILGALTSVLLIWVLLVYLFTEAMHRVVHP